MTVLRSPDGSWVGDVVRPEDVVNLKARGYAVESAGFGAWDPSVAAEVQVGVEADEEDAEEKPGPTVEPEEKPAKNTHSQS